MKQVCILSCFKKMLLLLLFFIVFDQNASIKENVIKNQEIYFTPNSELSKLFNSKWVVYTGASLLAIFSVTGIVAFIKYLFFDNNNQKIQKLEIELTALKTMHQEFTRNQIEQKGINEALQANIEKNKTKQEEKNEALQAKIVQENAALEVKLQKDHQELKKEVEGNKNDQKNTNEALQAKIVQENAALEKKLQEKHETLKKEVEGNKNDQKNTNEALQAKIVQENAALEVKLQEKHETLKKEVEVKIVELNTKHAALELKITEANKKQEAFFEKINNDFLAQAVSIRDIGLQLSQLKSKDQELENSIFIFNECWGKHTKIYAEMIMEYKTDLEKKGIKLKEELKEIINNNEKSYQELLDKKIIEYKQSLNQSQEFISNEIALLNKTVSESIVILKAKIEESTVENKEIISNNLLEYQNILEKKIKTYTLVLNDYKKNNEELRAEVEKEMKKCSDIMTTDYDCFDGRLQLTENYIKEESKTKIALKEQEVNLAKETLELQKKIYEYSITKNHKMKEFVETNKEVIEKIKDKIKAICEKIPNNDNQENNFYEEFITRNNIVDVESFNNQQDILSFVLDINFSSYTKIDTISVCDFVEYQVLKDQINTLISKYKQEYNVRKDAPDRHSCYKKNQHHVEKIIKDYTNFCHNISGDKITEEYNTIYQNIIKLYNDPKQDILIQEELLFKNAVEILSIEDIQLQFILDEVYQYLSKQNREALVQVSSAVKKEEARRKQDPARQYQWWVNKEGNQNKINDHKNKIHSACEKIKRNDIEGYKAYEFYKEKDIQEVWQLVLEENTGNDNEKEKEKEIFAVLLSAEYNQFKNVMNQEEKTRSKHPHRNSIYEENTEPIQNYINKLESIVKEVQDIKKITQEQNKLYEDLVESIDFDSNFELYDFIYKSSFVLKINFNGDIRNVFGCLEYQEKKEIENLYQGLKSEKEKRGKDRNRQYQWYINKNQDSIDNIKEKILDIATKIKNNEKGDNTYEKYFDKLNTDSQENHALVEKIIQNIDIDIDVEKIVSCFNQECKELKHFFQSEKNQREIDSERCYIGKQNKELIETYYSYMNQFVQDLDAIETINEVVNDRYNKMAILIQDDKIPPMVFFAKTLTLHTELINNLSVQDIYEKLNYEHKEQLNDFIVSVMKEKKNRSFDKSREYNWYVNHIQIRDNINDINKLINSFVECSKKDSDDMVFDEVNEDLYMSLLNKDKDLDVIKILFEKIQKTYDDNIDFMKLLCYINIDLLKIAIQKEHDNRLISPERSPSYNDVEQDVKTIMSSIQDINQIWGDENAEATEESNRVFGIISNKLIINQNTKINAEQFFKILCEAISIDNKKNNIWYFLSRSNREKVEKLLDNYYREKELRKFFASRGLTKEDKNILQEYRLWLEKEILSVLKGNILTNQEHIIAMFGVGARSYTDSMILFQHVLGVFFNNCQNNKQQSLEFINKKIEAISKYLDKQDEALLKQLQSLLLEANDNIAKNKEALEKEKRIRDNLLTFDKLSDKSLMFSNDAMIDESKKKIEDIEKEQNNWIGILKNERQEQIEKAIEKFNQENKTQIDFVEEYNNKKPFDFMFDFIEKLISEATQIKDKPNFLKCLCIKILCELRKTHLLLNKIELFNNIKTVENLKSFLEQIEIVEPMKSFNNGKTYDVSIFNFFSLLYNHTRDIKELEKFIKNILQFESIYILVGDDRTLGMTIEQILVLLYCNEVMIKGNKTSDEFKTIFENCLREKLMRHKKYLSDDEKWKEYVSDTGCLNKIDSIYILWQLMQKSNVIQINAEKQLEINIEYDWQQLISDLICYLNKMFLIEDNTIYSYDRWNSSSSNNHKFILKFEFSCNKYEATGMLKILGIPKNHQEYFKEVFRYQSWIPQNFYQNIIKYIEQNRDFSLYNIIEQKRNKIINKINNKIEDKLEELKSTNQDKIDAIKKEIQEYKDLKATENKNFAVISKEDLYDVPLSVIKYAFTMRIYNKLIEIKNMDEESTKLLLKQLKESNNNNIFSDNVNDDLSDLFNAVMHIENNDNVAFIKSLVFKTENYQECSVNKFKEICTNLINIVYNVYEKKVHYIFTGVAGTGKTSFIQYAIRFFINSIKNKQLQDYLKKNILLYKIAKSNYQTGSTVSENINGLFDDIKTLVSTKGHSILFVQMDEIDGLIKKKNDSRSGVEEVNMFLTLTDRIDFFFSLFGTTNLEVDAMEGSTIRSERSIIKSFPHPELLNIYEYIDLEYQKHNNILASLKTDKQGQYIKDHGIDFLKDILLISSKNKNSEQGGDNSYEKYSAESFLKCSNLMISFLNKAEKFLIYADIGRLKQNYSAFKQFIKKNQDEDIDPLFKDIL